MSTLRSYDVAAKSENARRAISHAELASVKLLKEDIID